MQKDGRLIERDREMRDERWEVRGRNNEMSFIQITGKYFSSNLREKQIKNQFFANFWIKNFEEIYEHFIHFYVT